MQKDDQVYLGHMLDTARKIAVKAAGVSRKQFESNEDFQIIFAHLVQVLGEAAARVSAACREQYAEIPWRRITGMRHRLVHDYMNIDIDVVWEVVRRNIPDLILALERIVPPEPK